MAITVASGTFTIENCEVGGFVVNLESGELFVQDSRTNTVHLTGGGTLEARDSRLAQLTVDQEIGTDVRLSNVWITGEVAYAAGLTNQRLTMEGCRSGIVTLTGVFSVLDIRDHVMGDREGNLNSTVPAISITGASGFFLGATIYRAGRQAVFLDGCADGEVEVLAIDPSTASDNTYDGIRIEDSDNIVVRGSVRGATNVSQNPRYGWSVDSDCTNIHMDVQVSGAQTGEYLNDAGLEVSLAPRFSTEDPDDGEVPIWDEAEGLWRPGIVSGGSGGGAVPEELSDLDDVDTAGAVTGDVLKFDGSIWVPGTDEEGSGSGGGGAEELDDLADVSVSGAVDGDLLMFDSGIWVPVAADSIVGSGGGGGGGFVEGGVLSDGASGFLSMPGVTIIGKGGSSFAVNTLRYSPIFLYESVRLRGLFGLLESGASAGRAMRVGLYEASFSLQPGDLVVEGEFDAGSGNGTRSVTADIVIPAGRYLLAWNVNSATPSWRRWNVNPGSVIQTGNTTPISSLTVASTYAAMGDPGTPWDTISAASGGLVVPVCLSIQEV